VVEYDEELANETDRVYRMPQIARQRLATLDALGLTEGEHVLDVGCGSGLLACWMQDLQRLSDEGSYFFCVNRFLFTAVRV